MTTEKLKKIEVQHLGDCFINSSIEEVKLELFNNSRLLAKDKEYLKKYFLDSFKFDVDFSSYVAEPVIREITTDIRPFSFKYKGGVDTLNYSWTGNHPNKKFQLTKNGDLSVSPIICLNVEIPSAINLNVVEKNAICIAHLKEFKSYLSLTIENRNKMLSDALDKFFDSEYFKMLSDKNVMNSYKESLEDLFKN